MGRSGTRNRLTALVLLPVLLCSATALLTISFGLADYRSATNASYGRAIAVQLSQLAADFVLGDDVLALNVLLDTELDRLPANYAALYDNDNRLLAQSGARQPSSNAISVAVTRNNESLGRLVLEVQPPPSAPLGGLLVIVVLLNGAVIVVTGLLTWFAGDYLWLWVHRPATPAPASEPGLPEAAVALEPEPTTETTVISGKLRPARLVPWERLTTAVQLYRGELSVRQDDEFMIMFHHAGQTEDALTCAAVIREVIRSNERLEYQIGIDQGTADNARETRKKARYLASLGNDTLLVTPAFHACVSERLRDRMGLAPFTSPMTGDGEVYCSERCDDLLKQQAAQLG